MKKIISIAAVFLMGILFLCGCEAEEGYPKPTERFFVNDFADVIDATDEDAIFNSAAALEKATTAQVVTVTVESLDGMEPYEYALELGREWGVGQEETNNGVVILLSTGDREIYIAVGYGLEGALPDSKTGRIIDVYGIEYLKNDDFSKGLTAIADAVVNEVYIEYGLEPESGYVAIDKIPENSYGEEASVGEVAGSWVAMMVLIILFFLIFGRRRRGFIWFGGPFGGVFAQRHALGLGIADGFVVNIGEVAHVFGAQPAQLHYAAEDILHHESAEVADVGRGIHSGTATVEAQLLAVFCLHGLHCPRLCIV